MIKLRFQLPQSNQWELALQQPLLSPLLRLHPQQRCPQQRFPLRQLNPNPLPNSKSNLLLQILNHKTLKWANPKQRNSSNNQKRVSPSPRRRINNSQMLKAKTTIMRDRMGEQGVTKNHHSSEWCFFDRNYETKKSQSNSLKIHPTHPTLTLSDICIFILISFYRAKSSFFSYFFRI